MVVEELILFTQYYSLGHLFVIKPFSLVYRASFSIILNTSSPSLSFKPFSFILNHTNIRIVPRAITHIQVSNAESLISHSVLTVIYYSPTIGFIIQHITFPSLSIITQIQHHIVFNPA